jgi:iron complex outermembrane receptor protein
MERSEGALQGSFAVFLRDFDNYINLVTAGLEEEDLPVFLYESTDARFWGMESEITLHLEELFPFGEHRLSLGSGLDFVKAEATNDDEDLPRIPPLRVKPHIHYSYSNVIALEVEAILAAKQDNTAPFELPTDSYSLLNATLDFHPSFLKDSGAELFLRATNLLDEEIRIHSSFLKDTAPERGRNFLLGFRFVL